MGSRQTKNNNKNEPLNQSSRYASRRPKMIVLSRKQPLTPIRLVRPLLAVVAIFYLLFHALHGERGIYAYIRDKRELANLQTELAQTKAQREQVELRVKHMRDSSLDLDLLDEQMRRQMGVMKPGEVMILQPDDSQPPARNAQATATRPEGR